MADILGVDDNLESFDPSIVNTSPFAAVREAWQRWGAWIRTPATGSIAECAALAILEQRVTGIESRRAWVQLVRTFGQPAPGPTDSIPPGMYVPPSPQEWRLIPSWEWHKAGVDPGRAATVIGLMQRASSLPRLLDLEPSQARQRLQSLPGIGVWTAAEIGHRALGDSDAVSFGDYHLPENIVYALTGQEGGTDEDLACVLEPVTGHRYRVQKLVERSGVIRPRKGPRITIQDHRNI
jgi:3-methyladenine DNA glycosylase/8-oxoguanine DNA glycosylase